MLCVIVSLNCILCPIRSSASMSVIRGAHRIILQYAAPMCLCCVVRIISYYYWVLDLCVQSRYTACYTINFSSAPFRDSLSSFDFSSFPLWLVIHLLSPHISPRIFSIHSPIPWLLDTFFSVHFPILLSLSIFNDKYNKFLAIAYDS